MVFPVRLQLHPQPGAGACIVRFTSAGALQEALQQLGGGVRGKFRVDPDAIRAYAKLQRPPATAGQAPSAASGIHTLHTLSARHAVRACFHTWTHPMHRRFAPGISHTAGIPTWRKPRQRIQHDGIYPQLVRVMVPSRICTDVMHLHITAVMHLQAPGLTRLAAHPACQRRRVRTQPDPWRLRRRRSRRCRNGRGRLIGRLCRRCGCRAVLIHGMIYRTCTGHSHAAAKMQGFALACGSYSACGSYRADVQAKLMGEWFVQFWSGL